MRSGKIRQEFVNIDHSDTDSIFTEGQKEFLTHYMQSIKMKKDLGFKSNTLQDEELPKNTLYDT